jgi:DNA adenine methylase
MITEVKEGLKKFPRTRYMGSKQKLLDFIYDNVKDFEFDTVLDAFSGSSAVAFLFKSMGKEVHANDFLMYSYMIAKATIENNKQTLTLMDVKQLLRPNDSHEQFITKTFKGLFFSDEDNLFLDQTLANINHIKNSHKKALALSALARACVKKRPRGIFTYTGMRYNDGRKDLRLSLQEQFLNSVEILNEAVLDNNQRNKAFNKDIFQIRGNKYDLVYIDPPYCSLHSDNDYSRRYHFVEGLMSNWKHVEINHNTKTKKFDKFSTPFDSKLTVYQAFDDLFKKFKDSILVVSYSNNSLPTKEEMVEIMEKYKKKVIVKRLNHRYSFGNQSKGLSNNAVKEYLFIGH